MGDYRKCSSQRPGRLFNFLRREGSLIRRGALISFVKFQQQNDTIFISIKNQCNIKIQKPYRKLLFANSHRPCTCRYRTEYRNSFFSGEGGGRLLQILSLRRGANSKLGAYLKLGANSSINGNLSHFRSYMTNDNQQTKTTQGIVHGSRQPPRFVNHKGKRAHTHVRN